MTASTIHAFLCQLDAHGTSYSLTSVREGAVMVIVALPGERWEVEYFADREPEVEVFRSDGTIDGPERIADLFRDAAR